MQNRSFFTIGPRLLVPSVCIRMNRVRNESWDLCAENGVEKAYTWMKVQYIKRDAISWLTFERVTAEPFFLCNQQWLSLCTVSVFLCVCVVKSIDLLAVWEWRCCMCSALGCSSCSLPFSTPHSQEINPVSSSPSLSAALLLTRHHCMRLKYLSGTQ